MQARWVYNLGRELEGYVGFREETWFPVVISLPFLPDDNFYLVDIANLLRYHEHGQGD